jgi:hypothetical protein
MAEPRVFVSYVQENRDLVSRLVYDLRRRGVNVWFDRDALPPGVYWRDEIRRAVRDHEYFIACFSAEFNARERTYMNEELELAIEEIRLRGTLPWFIPVLLSGEIPDRAIGAGRTLRDIQFVDLSREHWNHGVTAIVATVKQSRRLARAQPQPAVSVDRSAAKRNSESVAGAPISATALRAFLNDNRTARYLDRKIASFTLSRQLNEASEPAIESDVAALAVVGVSDLNTLERSLTEHKDLIARWAEDWLGGETGPLGQGVCLTYLGYIILCERGDFDGLLKFIEASHISSVAGPNTIAQEVVEKYQELA